jgi:1,4-alpha-glucan branching enzyme
MRGDFCLVLHGHLPWVLHHGWWPHGEFWLYEAAAETWMPLLTLFDECAAEGIRCPVTMGLMPVLLEQLHSPTFRRNFPKWLEGRQDQARRDRKEFSERGDLHLAWLAERWERHFGKIAQQFEDLGQNIPAAFAAHARAGRIELLTSNATHGFMPLILHDVCARAQVRAGVHTSERALGFRPRGAWLPECAYRPGGPWTPPVVHSEERMREGVEVLFSQEGIRYFVVDGQLLAQARSEGIQGPRGFEKVGWDRATWEPMRGWRSVLEPHGISSDGGPARLTVLGRHPEVSEQVWSGVVGYPGDGRYLEFHKKHGNDGLRYWKVTGPRADLGQKEAYYPDDVAAAAFGQARHFVAVVRAILERWFTQTGRPGCVTAPFDAELFGHWWFEGPTFLKEVFRAMAAEPGLRPCTVSERLQSEPPDKVVTLPAGSWGAGGDFRVWMNDELKWMWEAEYRAEDRFVALLHAIDWRNNEPAREALSLAARELLLLQASDWPFVIHTKGAVDYGYRRFCEHLARFDRACTVAESRQRGEEDTALARHALEDIRLNDPCFEDLRLEWWS